MSIWNQQQLFGPDDDLVNNDIVQRLYATLPKLPPLIRYYDDFDDRLRSIAEPAKLSRFELSINGVTTTVDFSRFDPRSELLFKHLFIFILGTDRSVATATLYITRAYPLPYSEICALIEAGPTGIALFWKEFRAREYSRHAYLCAKTMLSMLCEYKFDGWSDSYESFLSTTLPLPAIDKYAGVRAGDVFLSAEEEALIVRYFDMAVESVAKYSNGSDMDDLADTLMLICSYQFAMRPIQIAKLERS